jgi:hypothetical protein
MFHTSICNNCDINITSSNQRVKEEYHDILTQMKIVINNDKIYCDDCYKLLINELEFEQNTSITTKSNHIIYALDESCNKYQFTKSLFDKTKGQYNHQIIRIEENVNDALYDKFTEKIKTFNNKTIEYKFHATTNHSNYNDILSNGFKVERSNCGGTFFANNASYSLNGYSHKLNITNNNIQCGTILLCEICLGDANNHGNSSDTCFLKENFMSYPRYIIHYII